MTGSPSPLIIPVENQVRELDAKLLLACVAAERGLPVVLGSRTYINFAMPHLPRGLFVAKSMRSLEQAHRSTSFEASVTTSWHGTKRAWCATNRPSTTPGATPRTPSRSSTSCSRGARTMPSSSRAIPATTARRCTSPEIRASTCCVRKCVATSRREVAALRRRYGDFILVNTNFSFVNNFVPSLNLIERDAQGRPRVSRTGRGMSLAFAVGMAAHQQAIYDHFRELMPQLAAWFPDHRIVLRPHPSENHEAWRQILAGCPQVDVVHEGNVVPWLMAARVLLHNGCTTAVEASVLETPAVSYMPVASETYDYICRTDSAIAPARPRQFARCCAKFSPARVGLWTQTLRRATLQPSRRFDSRAPRMRSRAGRSAGERLHRTGPRTAPPCILGRGPG